MIDLVSITKKEREEFSIPEVESLEEYELPEEQIDTEFIEEEDTSAEGIDFQFLGDNFNLRKDGYLGKHIYPLTTVGEINVVGQSKSSGVLIGPRHVLTCYHNLRYDHKGRLFHTVFTPSLNRGLHPNNKKVPYGSYKVVRALHQGFRKYTKTNDFASTDWAILVLDQPINLRPAKAAKLRPETNRKNWCHIGYPLGHGRPFYDDGIEILHQTNHTYQLLNNKIIRGSMLTVNSPQLPGCSGGPLFKVVKDPIQPRRTLILAGIFSHSNGNDARLAGITSASLKFIQGVVEYNF